jgi:hypothetical protein
MQFRHRDGFPNDRVRKNQPRLIAIAGTGILAKA